MLASDLIAALTTIIVRCGDIEVAIHEHSDDAVDRFINIKSVAVGNVLEKSAVDKKVRHRQVAMLE